MAANSAGRRLWRPFAQGLLGPGVHLHQNAVRPGGHGGQGQGGHQLPLARRVAGVHHHRQMGVLLEQGHGRDVQGVAGLGLKGADAPLAEHHLPVAPGQNVLGRK